MQIYPPLGIMPRLLPGVKIGDSFVSIEYSERPGREGRVRYLYHIDTPDFEFSADDLQSGAGGGDLMSGIESLFSFLGAAAEARHYTKAVRESDNDNMFPEKVMEWCDANSSEIEMIGFELQEMLERGDTAIEE